MHELHNAHVIAYCAYIAKQADAERLAEQKRRLRAHDAYQR